MLNPFDFRKFSATSSREYKFDGKRILIKEPAFSVSNEVAIPCYWTLSTDSSWYLRTKGKPTTMTKLNDCLGTLADQIGQELGVDKRYFLVQSACEARFSSKSEYGKDPLSPRTEIGYPGRTGEDDTGDTTRDALDDGTHCSFGLTQLLLATARQVAPEQFKGVSRPQHRYQLAYPSVAFTAFGRLIKTYPEDVQLDPMKTRVSLGAGGVYHGSGPWGVRLYNESVILHWMAFWNDLVEVLA